MVYLIKGKCHNSHNLFRKCGRKLTEEYVRILYICFPVQYI